MCGIAGIISPNITLVTAERLKKMTDTLAHRGPDGEGQWINDASNVALGHRRLSIIDLSNAGAQPMHYLNRYTIIHNGEIYNYIELKEELQKKGYSFTTQTDTEVIAASYDCWEEECVDHFDGMFSFAIWDKETKTLFAARDRFGEKPFYYYFDMTQFVFASEIKALWAAGIERKPNMKMLFNYMTIGYTDNPQNPVETFFENINKLPPATSLTYYADTHEMDSGKYWDIQIDEDNKITDEEAEQTFTHLFQISIQRRLRSDVEVGTSLSGGLDSSSIVSIIRSRLTHDTELTAFTASFPGFEKDESVYASLIAEKFNLKHHTIPVTETDLIQDFEKVFYHQEEPFNSSSVMAQYKVYELAKQRGIKVLLDGQGADETLAGYHKYFKWYWQELFMKRKLIRSREMKAARQNGIDESFGVRNIVAALFPDFASVFLERQYLLTALRHKDLSPEFLHMQSKGAYYAAPENFNLNGVLYFNTMQHGLEELLRYSDRNAMAHGREIRLPFLNHDLIEFLFRLPAKFKIRNGWTKWLLRNTIGKGLPDEITWRKDKTGFEPPQKQWMQHKQVQHMIYEAKKKLVSEKMLKPDVLNKKIQPQGAYAAENYDWRYLVSAMLL
jgi:asparagine synthase (glutamine-hydrolysing)